MANTIRGTEDKRNSHLSEKKQVSSQNSTNTDIITAVITNLDTSSTAASSTLHDIINVASSAESTTLPSHEESPSILNERISTSSTTVFEDRSSTGQYSTSNTVTASDDFTLRELTISQLPKKMPSTTMTAIKVLVSNNMAGSIIGRSGKTISDLQVQSSSRIKLSQSGACYPGTTDRVCLIQGQLDNVKKALGLILQQLDIYRQQIAQQQINNEAILLNENSTVSHYHQDAVVEREDEYDLLRGNKPPRTRQNQSEEIVPSDASESLRSKLLSNKSQFFNVRLLIPTACSGMIIGRGGCNVKSIAESSGVASIRLAPKEGDVIHQTMVTSLHQQQQATPSLVLIPQIQTTSERIVTITGQDLSCCVKCCDLILDDLALQPDLSRYTNMTTNYTKSPTTANATFVTSSSNDSNVIDSIASLAVTSPPSFTSSFPISQRQQQQQSLPPIISGQHFPPSNANVMRFPSSQPPSNIGVTGLINHQHHPGAMLRYNNCNAFTPADANPSSSNTPLVLPTSQIPINSLTAETGTFNPSHHQQPPMSQSLYLVASPSLPGSMFVHAPPRPVVSSSTLEDQGIHHMTQQYAPSRLPTSNRNSAEPLIHFTPPSYQNSNIKANTSQQEHQQPLTRQMTVPDFLIGAIIGRKGQTLTELQLTTNTKIKISQRGAFVPGTNDRIVTITGPTPINISNAQYFISQRLARAANRIRTTKTATEYSGQPQQYNPTPSSSTHNQGIQNAFNQASALNKQESAFDHQQRSPPTSEDDLKPSALHNMKSDDKSN
uniref:K Homology domain-containing protein n=1 Tax=Eucampia antarctica TaxID=49252 RepID=A0A7S2W8E1_9STRA|mmetsp:Transcript_22646/g.21769  ORF Transcript_22646/g.21769 Transcript_22646/m.21769 type:complete len:778 (+) Transcript_22646:186-2519(+)